MFGIKKRKIQVWSVTISLLVFLGACSERTSEAETVISGETQGTTYTIKIIDENVNVTQEDFDDLFSRFDLSLSTYIENSVISQINASESDFEVEDKSGYFKECYQLSQGIFERTSGAFDPSVFPLVKGWGFMNNMESPLSQTEVDSLLQFVSFEKEKLHDIQFSSGMVKSSNKTPGFKLDFNAIAQGLSVDVVDRFLKEKGFTDYYIEIGGELIVRGHNADGIPWRIGVDNPQVEKGERDLESILNVSECAIATSGNYRKFYVRDGIKYAHTLDPKTGFPVQHSLLSATVIAESCALADAYATAFMVMGVDKTMDFLAANPDLNLKVYLLYADNDGNIQRRMTEDFDQYWEKVIPSEL